jgi:hypothetical protein
MSLHSERSAGEFRSAPVNGHRQVGAAGLFGADVVAKVFSV